MSIETLEKRVAVLEDEVARLKQEQEHKVETEKPWWEKIRGRFKDDPAYVEAMRLGREYRESLRPKDDEEA
jgi:hypothetical protein